jgi:hypothetical protein
MPRGSSPGWNVTFTRRIEMPVWESYRCRLEAKKREWDRFYLLWHEHGHIAIIRREAKTIYQRLLAANEDTINNVAEKEKRRMAREGRLCGPVTAVNAWNGCFFW